MKKWSIVWLTVCVMVAMVGCGGGGTDPTETAPGDAAAPTPETTPAAAPEPAPAPEPAAVTTPDAAPAEGAAAPAATGLEGSTWKVDQFTITFKDASTINVKGGPLGEGEGVPGTYTVQDGAITISAMGQSKSGTWDGTSMIIDNTPGVKM